MNKTSLTKKIIILVVILIIPGFLYYLLTVKGQNRYHPLQVFGPKSLAKTFHKVKGKKIPDTIFHTLADFQLLDQQGKQVTSKTLDDKIFVANFFYTGCPVLCTTINGYMDSLARNYVKSEMVRFVSITVDPQRDSVRALDSYSKKFDNFGPNWKFLTGDTATIYRLARKGFLVDALDQGKGDFIYSDKLILVDSHKRIRGYYDASIKDVARLNDEIKVLLSEEYRNKEEPLY